MYLALMTSGWAFEYGAVGISLAVVCLIASFAVPIILHVRSVKQILNRFPYEGDDMA